MIKHERWGYDVLLSGDPVDLFDHFGTDHLHGLTRSECEAYGNSESDAYIAGMANVTDGRPFVFINLSRCGDDMVGLVVHEAAHLQFIIQGYASEYTEEGWVEGLEAIAIDLFRLIKQAKNEQGTDQ